MGRLTLLISLLLLTCASAVVPTSAAGFHQVKLGDPVPGHSGPSFDGGTATLWEQGKVGLFVFFRPDKDASRKALVQLGALRGKLADKDITWVGIVSEAHDPKAVREAMNSAKLTVPVLVDAGDALYGKIGVVLLPSIGIVDGKGTLVAYLPYAQVNYAAMVEAHLLRALGELDAAGAKRMLEPTATVLGGDDAVARRNVNLGEKLLEAKDFDKALRFAERALQKAPRLSAAHLLKAAALAGAKRCEEARSSAQQAAELGADAARAAAVVTNCATEPSAPND